MTLANAYQYTRKSERPSLLVKQVDRIRDWLFSFHLFIKPFFQRHERTCNNLRRVHVVTIPSIDLAVSLPMDSSIRHRNANLGNTVLIRPPVLVAISGKVYEPNNHL